MLKKMHLADMAALDGVISNVRLWKIGYIDQTNVINSIIPSADILRKFEAMLRANLAGGVLDVVWGPDIEFKESSSTSYNFLLPEKYQKVIRMRYINGLSLKEISVLTKQPENTVAVQIHRALAKLKTLYTDI